MTTRYLLRWRRPDGQLGRAPSTLSRETATTCAEVLNQEFPTHHYWAEPVTEPPADQQDEGADA